MNKTIKNIRTNILNLTYKAQSSHIGSCLSIVEILITLYNKILKKDDRFILSKGHAALALYSTLYEKKKISLKTLNTFGLNKTVLMNHVSHKVNGVEFSTGSLGHGLPIGVGMAKFYNDKGAKSKIIVMLGDGELNEGSIWESMLLAVKWKLKNLIIIIDKNKFQANDKTEKILKINNIAKLFKEIGFQVLECNGHNYNDINRKFMKISNIKPVLIIANTIRNFGIKEIQNTKAYWFFDKSNKNISLLN